MATNNMAAELEGSIPRQCLLQFETERIYSINMKRMFSWVLGRQTEVVVHYSLTSYSEGENVGPEVHPFSWFDAKNSFVRVRDVIFLTSQPSRSFTY